MCWSTAGRDVPLSAGHDALLESACRDVLLAMLAGYPLPAMCWRRAGRIRGCDVLGDPLIAPCRASVLGESAGCKPLIAPCCEMSAGRDMLVVKSCDGRLRRIGNYEVYSVQTLRHAPSCTCFDAPLNMKPQRQTCTRHTSPTTNLPRPVHTNSTTNLQRQYTTATGETRHDDKMRTASSSEFERRGQRGACQGRSVAPP